MALSPAEALAGLDKLAGNDPQPIRTENIEFVSEPAQSPVVTVDPRINPEEANRLGDLAMGKRDDTPLVAPRPPNDELELPCGWLDREGNLHKTIRIREMNGSDEEELAKPYQRTVARFIDTIVNRCVVDMGGTPEKRQLDQLLLGDRDAIVLGVRALTYGNLIDIPVVCPNCRHDFTVELNLASDIAVKELPGDPKQRQREVKLTRGGVAVVNLMTGESQLHAYDGPDVDNQSDAESISLILRECVFSIRDEPITTLKQCQDMPSQTRRDIITFLNQNTCGPKWQEVQQECPECLVNNPLPLNLPGLFL